MERLVAQVRAMLACQLSQWLRVTIAAVDLVGHLGSKPVGRQTTVVFHHREQSASSVGGWHVSQGLVSSYAYVISPFIEFHSNAIGGSPQVFTPKFTRYVKTAPV
jgi:hypothetical protein